MFKSLFILVVSVLCSCEKVQPLLSPYVSGDSYDLSLRPVYPQLNQNSSYIEVQAGNNIFYLEPLVVFEKPFDKWYQMKAIDTSAILKNSTFEFSFSLPDLKPDFYVIDSTFGELLFNISSTNLPASDVYKENLNAHYKGCVQIVRSEPLKIYNYDAVRMTGTAYIPVRHVYRDIRGFFTVRFNNVIVLIQ